MKFIVDAQLPKRLADALALAGYDAIHTLSLPQQNRTTDNAIAELADREQRIVVSKDADFVTSHLVVGTPRYLLEISTGNLPNADLLPLVLRHLDRIEMAFATATHVELAVNALIIHG
jgi:predicted nuclease of predicted toxin-antitoxin system